MKRQNFFWGLVALASIAAQGGELVLTPAYAPGDLELACGARSCAFRGISSVYQVKNSASDLALKGLTYSALGWVADAETDLTRTVTITAQAGSWADGVFTSDGSAEVTVLPVTTGQGEFDWEPVALKRKVYQLKHVVSKNGIIDQTARLVGHLDFTQCVFIPLQRDFEKAVFSASDRSVVAVQDVSSPWTEIDPFALQSGVETQAELAQGDVTQISFSFDGSGRFCHDFRVSGGTLEVFVDGELAAICDEPSAVWATCAIEIDEEGLHTVVFRYTAAGGGAAAAIRHVCVKGDESISADLAVGSCSPVRVDFQKGVRTPKRLAHVLPFAYSPTNFTGSVNGTVSRVSVVQLAGDDPDVTKWTAEVAGTARVLKIGSDEGAVVWKAKQGVWRATYDILNGSKEVRQGESILDLREAKGSGFVMIVF